MTENQAIQACIKLKVENQFLCKRNRKYVNPWDCKTCSYLYQAGDQGLITRCLLKEIRDWTLYRIEEKTE